MAASFSSVPAAEAASAALRLAFHLGPRRLLIAPLGHATYPVHPDTVMAGEFDETDVAAVREIVASFGGTIVAEVNSRQ